ncbi:MAG: OadG family protein [Paludibacteraceae bacterium]|nr:OadG family protein [Paludibacteraceae bacterium]
MLILNITNWNELLIGSAVGISVVFIALVTLVLCFEGFQRFIVKSTKKKVAKKEGKKEEEIVDIAANEIAAVSMALHLFFNEMHDEESNIITIKRIERRYSPWNSKIYGLNNLIQR